jgi:dimethylhistidine N-methyltransferase
VRSEGRARPLVRFVTPAPVGTRLGNRVTALRWAGLVRQLGLRVAIDEGSARGPADLLVALHAAKSGPAVHAFRAAHPTVPILVALTGTDVYDLLGRTPQACDSLWAATRIIALQPRAADELPEELRPRTRAIFQFASAPRPVRPAEGFVVAELAHLRAVKDVLLPARAARLLPAASRVQVVHFGGAIDAAAAREAETEAADNRRYEWRGDVPRSRALSALAGCDLVVVPSRLEGGSNVVSEAIAAGVPVVSTRIGGSTGLLGDAYPGLFPIGDAPALAALLERVEREAVFRAELQAWCDRLRPLVDPVREREAWRELLAEVGLPTAARRGPDPRLFVVSTPVETERAALARDVAEGLARRPRRLSCRFFYDRDGSALFEEICRLPAYYLTRAEREILEDRAPAIAATMPPGTLLFELGCGNAEKTRLLLDAFCRRQGHTTYVPVDVSREMLEQTARVLLAEEAALDVRAIAGEYEAGLAGLDDVAAPARLVLWLGSNIGNLERPAAAAFLGRVRERLGATDRVLVGIDLRKSKDVLEPAYDDPQGVTARFNKNLLARIDRELDADFALDDWVHRALYDELAGKIEMWLVSRCAQGVRIGALGLEVAFDEGEAVHTEDSHKYSPDEIGALALGAGLVIRERWTDRAGRFALVLFAPR